MLGEEERGVKNDGRLGWKNWIKGTMGEREGGK